MPVLKGPLTARRYRVIGEVPPGFRELYAQKLLEHRFVEPASATRKEEVEGWVEHRNLLDTGFADVTRWLSNQYALFALRVDKKALPARLFKATLEKRVQAWCEEHQADRCPRSVRDELRDLLEDDWLARTLPRVAVHEAVWNLDEAWLLLLASSDRVNDRFRKRFLVTFNLELVPETPLFWIEPELAEALARTGGTDLRGVPGEGPVGSDDEGAAWAHGEE